jgi:hypothetical protein
MCWRSSPRLGQVARLLRSRYAGTHVGLRAHIPVNSGYQERLQNPHGLNSDAQLLRNLH